MSEKEVVSPESKISYEGFFEPKQLFRVIQKWLKENHYDLVEKEAFEKALDNKRFAKYSLEPFKAINDYAKFIIKLKITLSDLEDVVVEYHNQKLPMSKGKVSISLTGVFETDYENRWDTKPFYFFLLTIFNKFILKTENTYLKGRLKDEINSLKFEIKSFLNLYRF
ncbi:MAG: hypothetical protein PWP03_359 [Candidatus Woesearchaeota archaeon]|nr:hypothetical protein [Candidatus Woesearchaeota archaeon]MDN5327721.1 hypothetical protein [Candidatus Woesearchaeota archaeon]